MSIAGRFTFPVDHAVFLSEVFEDENLMAIVAPAPFKGCHYYGIVSTWPLPWRFPQGPSVARTEDVWAKLAAINPKLLSEECYVEFCEHHCRAGSLDDFIDIVNAPIRLKTREEGGA